jgi:hypothetical protein
MTDRFEDEANSDREQTAMGTPTIDEQDQEFELALKEFKSSVHAWGEAAYSRPRTLAPEVRHRSWRLASGWALGCLLVAGSVSGGLFQRHHKLVLAQMAEQQRVVDQQKQLRELEAGRMTDEALLSGVDSDVSRQVPSAFEPLAQMSEDETK